MRKNKKKPASPKRAKKKSVKMKDLPAKHLEDREILGGAASNLSAKNLQLGGAALRSPDALNLG